MTDAEYQALIDKVQTDAEAHLDYCYATMWEGEEEDAEGALEPLAPFCGCTTCVVREVLHASFEGMKRLLDDEVHTQTSPPR